MTDSNEVMETFAVVEDVVAHVLKMADKYGFNLDADGITFESIDNSATHLGYVLSNDMLDAAIAMIYDQQ